MKQYRFVTLCASALLLIGSSYASELRSYHPNRLIVALKSAIPQSSLKFAMRPLGALRVEPLFRSSTKFEKRIFIAEFSDSMSRLAAEESLRSNPDVGCFERDYYMQLFNDPLFRYQWSLENSGEEHYTIIRVPGSTNDTLKLTSGEAGSDIGRTLALQNSHDRDRVRVAIIDTGVDYEHPDLADNIWKNASEEQGQQGVDDDFNGYIDDVVGYDFSGDVVTGFTIIPDSDPIDTIGHGTHCAGIVGAVSGNDIGIEGISPNVEIMCLKIFPNALASASAEAIVYAVENGAKVINASWGSPFYSSILNDAIDYAVANGVLVVAASGNTGTSIPFFPARLDHALTVGATNSLDQVTYFSTYGDWLDLCAPGQDILSLRANNTDLYEAGGEPLIHIIDENYYLADGTSMAAPHVVGASALLLSISPGLRVDSLRNLLINSADQVEDPNGRVPVSFSPFAGWGRVNVGRAAGMLADEYAEIEQPLPNEIRSGLIAVTGSAFSSTGKQFVLEAKPASAEEWLVVSSGVADEIRTTLANWDSSPFDGRTEIRLSIGQELAYTTSVRLVNSPVIELIDPLDEDTVFSVIDIVGSASVPEFRSYQITYSSETVPKRSYLIKSSKELLYRQSLAEWTVGQIPPGSGTLKLEVTSASGVQSVSRHVFLKSSIVEGYPRDPGVKPHYCSTAGDIDGDGTIELLTGSKTGIIRNDFDEQRIELIPLHGATISESSIALEDLDRDGNDEIICVTDSGVAVLDGNGEYLPGWPKRINTGYQYNALPTPLVTDIDGDSLMEIVIVTAAADIFCWHYDGRSYFNTTRGYFAQLDTRGLYRVFGGSFVAHLFAYDFDHDGYQDIGTLYTTLGSNGGLYLYSGKNGAPLFPEIGARVFSTDGIFGGALADFDNDGEPEIAFAHWYSANLAMGVHIVEADGTSLPGWPKLFDDKIQFLSPYPAVADLDNDSVPELICVFSAVDGGEVYVWHGDGRPYLEFEFGRSDGYFAGTINSLSNPIILDVDDDGELEIVSRGGAVFLGKPERLFAWNLDGSVVSGWPIYTYADPSTVTYAPHTPVAGDFDNDGLLELYMGSSDNKLYCWDLPTPNREGAIAWGNFLRDNRHSAQLPAIARPAPPQPTLPEKFRLSQNYPNPFNQSTVIQFDLDFDSKVTVEILNVLGQKVASLTDESYPAGVHRLEWDGRDDKGRNLASGVYFYRLRMNNFSETKRMVLLK